MSVIYKYPLVVDGSQDIRMPEGARILCVQVQRETPCIWAAVDANPHVLRRLRILPTGGAFDEEVFGTYVGTFQLSGGDFIGHLFDGGEIR